MPDLFRMIDQAVAMATHNERRSAVPKPKYQRAVIEVDVSTKPDVSDEIEEAVSKGAYHLAGITTFEFLGHNDRGGSMLTRGFSSLHERTVEEIEKFVVKAYVEDRELINDHELLFQAFLYHLAREYEVEV